MARDSRAGSSAEEGDEAKAAHEGGGMPLDPRKTQGFAVSPRSGSLAPRMIERARARP